MSDVTTDLRASEHAALRNEILQNKKLTFERPLLILSGAAVAAAQVHAIYAVWFMPIALIAFLWLNVSFTEDRMRSTARVASYIGLFLESHPQEWIGWENALRKYRERFSTKGNKIQDAPPASAGIQGSAIQSSLFWIHVLPAVLGLCGLGIALYRAHRSLEILIAAATAALALPFLRACLRAFNPTSAIGKLDSQRTRWLESIKPTTEKTGQG
jgi:hypothetical protein